MALMPVDEIGEVVVNLAGVVVRQAGGLVIDLTVEHVFSGHSARFFHGVGRRLIRMTTLGGIRIPSSLRTVPKGADARPRRSDWVALWIGVFVWIIIFLAIGVIGSRFL